MISEPLSTPAPSSPATSRYTVFGLWLEDEAVVAGVVEGEHCCVDQDPRDTRFQGRWSTSVEATNPAHAEELAVAEMEDALPSGEDD